MPALEPKAIEVLKASSSRLAAARTLSFTAVASYESPSRVGPALVYTTRSLVTLQRPDKLRVIQTGDGPANEFYYNGKTMMAFMPAEKLVAGADAPPTVDAMLEAAHQTHGTYFPFTDAIVADPYGDIAKATTSSAYSAGVAAGSANTAAVYNAGVAAGSASTTSAYNTGLAAGSASGPNYVMGGIYPTLPAGCMSPKVQGGTYYLCGNTWFQPSYGANGVYYRVVTTP